MNCKYTKVLENAKIDAFLIAFPQIILFSLAIQYQLLDTDTLDAFKAVWLHMIILHKRMRLHLLSSFLVFPSLKKERIGIDGVLSEIGFHSFFSFLYYKRSTCRRPEKILEVGERVWYECGILMQGLYWCLSGPGLR